MFIFSAPYRLFSTIWEKNGVRGECATRAAIPANPTWLFDRKINNAGQTIIAKSSRQEKTSCTTNILPCTGWINISRNQSVTSRLETSQYRDFPQFFESIGLGLEIFGLEKKSRYRSRKYLVSKKSLSNDLKNLVSKKSQ